MQRRRMSLNTLGHVLVLALVSPSAFAVLWNDVSQVPAAQTLSGDSAARAAAKIDFKHRLLNADPSAIRQQLLNAASAQARSAAAVGGTIELPMPDGSMRQYTVEDSPVMAAELADKYPEIKTFKVRAVDSPAMSGRVSSTPLGFHGYLDTENGTVFIDPVRGSNAQQYRAYYKLDYALAHKDTLQPFSCGVHDRTKGDAALILSSDTASKTAAKTEGNLRSYRIAVATTGEYSQTVAAGNATNTLTQVVIAIDRVNDIYERDLGVHLELVANNNLIIFTDPATDGYTNDNDTALLDENQLKLTNVIGSANYDIGHVFSTGGGGLASLGVVCDNSRKARGETGLSDPTGDPFYIDYVAHEIGHQFNAEHTFNGTSGSCGGLNRNPTTAVEPGSGSTVMSYAGICGAENIASQADAVFHAVSIDEIATFTRAGAASACSANGANAGNVAPAVVASGDYTIPGGTYFELTGAATDTDSLLYHWDEMDVGVATNSATLGRDLGSNALFRSFPPGANANYRPFPALTEILSGATALGETLPTESRTLNFRLTASDDKGGVNSDDTQVIVNSDAGPFKVLQPNSFVILDSSQQQVIEWNAACSEQPPVNCANVDILLSEDGGMTFPHTLLSATPNVGEASVSLAPVTSAAQARVRIQCTDNIFFDVSDTSFQISNGTGNVLASTGNGGSYNCGTSTGGAAGGDIEPNDSPSLANFITLPVSINGSVTELSDVDDYFVFIGDGKTYSFSISGYGSNDLDLYLYDTNLNQIELSESTFATAESFSAVLSSGESYFLLVTAFDTSFQTSPYTLAINLNTDGGGGGSMGFAGLLLLLLSRLPLLRKKPGVKQLLLASVRR